MTGFDFAFALFSLLLGLSVAEILGGFAGMMKLHARGRAGLATGVRTGRLVPLLATLVVLNQLSFWMIAYSVRETLPFSYLTLLGTLIVVGGYYLFSVLVFPDNIELWPDFDAYYDRHNRFILAGMFVLNLAGAVVGNLYHPKVTAAQQAARDSPIGDFAALAVFGGLILLLILIFAKSRRLNAILLALLIAMNLGGSVLVVMAGLG
ncbi:MAG: hypothetical protein JWO25_997 [Alphaproteobacteria bacterium]|nr:hypothetical protein [Alphaproteobacteria bacterium]